MWLEGSQFPDQGSNLGPLQWEHRVLTTGPPGKSLTEYSYVPGIVEHFLRVRLIYSFQLSIEGVPLRVPILQMRKLRPWEMKQDAWCHTAAKQQS